MKALMVLGAICAFGFIADSIRAEDHVGPHKGAVCEWGEEEYHLEVVTDAKTGDVTVYVYGDHKAFDKGTFKAIDSKSLTLTIKGDKPITVKLEPKAQKDDPKDSASMFTGKNDALKTDKKVEGSISGKIGTKPYTGDFKQK